MRILVTGGAGYIGSHAVRALLSRGHEVVVLDNLATGHRAAVDPRAELVVGDIREARDLERCLRGVEAVLHFAARSIVGESVRHPLAYWDNNVTGSLTLLRAVHAYGIRRFVFSSTAATYGVPDDLPITEDTPQRPINPYGSSKLAVETALRELCDADDTMAAAALRYFNVAGCAESGDLGEDHQPETHLIPIVLQAAAGRRDAISIFGTDYPTPDGTCVRDYVHVEDLVEAHLVVLDALATPGFRPYNVGIGKGHSVREVIEVARRVTGRSFAVREAERRAGDPPVLYTRPDKLMTELGWSPVHTELDGMIHSTWNWVRRYPRGFDDRAEG